MGGGEGGWRRYCMVFQMGVFDSGFGKKEGGGEGGKDGGGRYVCVYASSWRVVSTVCVFIIEYICRERRRRKRRHWVSNGSAVDGALGFTSCLT